MGLLNYKMSNTSRRLSTFFTMDVLNTYVTALQICLIPSNTEYSKLNHAYFVVALLYFNSIWNHRLQREQSVMAKKINDA